ncbi:MAG: hypothetical protein QGG42_01245 [Phycisphaerae bacterium]|jgi:hypothetical protein|nr:hypothetical protein [Phycisphaerae bacterium]
MDWLHWLLFAVVMFLLPAQFLQKKAEKVFDPETYSYSPSSGVLDFIAAGRELEAIRLIRHETGLGLKEGRDLCRHLKSQQPFCPEKT